MQHHTAGDPVKGYKWSRKSTYTIASELKRFGVRISPSTVRVLLKAEGYSQ
jgi:hypothetical protein